MNLLYLMKILFPLFLIYGLLYWTRSIFIYIPNERINYFFTLIDQALNDGTLTFYSIMLDIFKILIVIFVFALLRRVLKNKPSFFKKIIVLFINILNFLSVFIISMLLYYYISASSLYENYIVNGISEEWIYNSRFVIVLSFTIIIILTINKLAKLAISIIQTPVKQNDFLSVQNSYNQKHDDIPKQYTQETIANTMQHKNADVLIEYSTDKILYEFVRNNGLTLYSWKRECWKCKKQTNIISYFLDYEIEQQDESFDSCTGPIGIGYIPCIDNILARKYKNIELRYSHASECEYVCNVCEHCGAIQGRNYVVDDPHEILHDLMSGDMKKYYFCHVDANSFDLDIRDFEMFKQL